MNAPRLDLAAIAPIAFAGFGALVLTMPRLAEAPDVSPHGLPSTKFMNRSRAIPVIADGAPLKPHRA